MPKRNNKVGSWRRARKPMPFDHEAVTVLKKNGRHKTVWWLAVWRFCGGTG